MLVGVYTIQQQQNARRCVLLTYLDTHSHSHTRESNTPAGKSPIHLADLHTYAIRQRRTSETNRTRKCVSHTLTHTHTNKTASSSSVLVLELILSGTWEAHRRQPANSMPILDTGPLAAASHAGVHLRLVRERLGSDFL